MTPLLLRGGLDACCDPRTYIARTDAIVGTRSCGRHYASRVVIGNDTENWSGPEGILAINQVGAGLRALSAMLSPLGRPVVTAGSGPRALALASKKTFAVIVLDVLTSNADAIELVLKLRALPRVNRTPIILLTGQEPSTKTLNRLQQTGLVDYILRPVPPELLRNKVATIVSAQMQEGILRQLQGSLAEKDRTIAMLAHELQNPNGAIPVETMYRFDEDENVPGWLRQLSRLAEWVSDMDRNADDDGRLIDVRPSDARPPEREAADLKGSKDRPN